MAKLFWITGLSGSGKTSIAKRLNLCLKDNNVNTIILDGDIIRSIVGEEKNYSVSNRKKMSYIYSKLGQELINQNYNVIISTISMFDEVRNWNRENIIEYYEVYLKVDHDVLQQRDPKKLYLRNKYSNSMVNFKDNTDYEVPKNPDLIINTSTCSIEQAVNKIIGGSSILKDLQIQ